MVGGYHPHQIDGNHNQDDVDNAQERVPDAWEPHLRLQQTLCAWSQGEDGNFLKYNSNINNRWALGCMGTLQVKKNEKVKRIKARCSWWSIDHHLTMKTLLRRQQVESLACGCAVSSGTAKLMVHFKRYKHWSSFNHLHHEHAGGQVHWQEGGRGEVPPASWNLLHSERTTSGDDHAGIRDQLFVLCLSNVFDIFGLERIENPGCFILSMKLIVFFPTRYAIAFVPSKHCRWK